MLAAMLREQERRVTNVVMMGMGEPFLNYDEVLAACRTLNDPAGFGLGARQIAVSTAGWIPGIERLAAEPMQLRLALSLHAPNDELRADLMPVNRRFPLAKLMAACRPTGRPPVAGSSSSTCCWKGSTTPTSTPSSWPACSHERRLPRQPDLLQPDSGRVPGSDETRVAGFARVLAKQGVSATYRSSHGRDIDAACGQLAVGNVRGLRRRNRAAARGFWDNPGMSAAETMGAWVIRPERLGDPVDAMQLEQIEIPEPGPGEVLVLVWPPASTTTACGRRWGSRSRSSTYTGYDFHIGGSDASGIVWNGGPGRHPLEAGRRGRHPLQPELRPVPRVQRAGSDGLHQQKIWAYESNWGSFAAVLQGAGPAAPAQAPRLTWEEAASYGLDLLHRLPHADRPGRAASAGDNVLIWGAGGGLGIVRHAAVRS